MKLTSLFKHQNQTFDLATYYPSRDISSPLPTVMLFPAWDGLNDPIKTIAKNIANLGYVVAAVDLYGCGIRGQVHADNSHLMQPLLNNRKELLSRMLAAMSHLKKTSGVDAQNMAGVGYCFGGLCALDLARHSPDGLVGVVSFHGLLHRCPKQKIEPISSRVLIEHGYKDPMASFDSFIQFTQEMDSCGADWQAHVHGRAMHAFTFKEANSPENGVLFDELASARSWWALESHLKEIFINKISRST